MDKNNLKQNGCHVTKETSADLDNYVETPCLMFMYGTLKTKQPNHGQLFAADPEGVEFIGHGETESRYPLIVTTPWNIPFVLHSEGKGKHVKGEIYRVSAKALKFIDLFEMHPDWYRRMKTWIKVVDEPNLCEASKEHKEMKKIPDRLMCWLYFLPKFKTSLLDLPTLGTYNNSSGLHPQYRLYDSSQGPIQHYVFDEESDHKQTQAL